MSAEQDKVRSIAERVASRLGVGASRADDDGARTDGEAGGGEVAALRDALREMQQRLTQIESRVGRGDAGAQPASREERSAAASSSRDESASSSSRGEAASSSSRDESASRGQSQARWPRQLMSTTYVPATHPSLERFGIDDAVSELVDFFESEKTCTVEPGGKPCDHCALCSTRGF